MHCPRVPQWPFWVFFGDRAESGFHGFWRSGQSLAGCLSLGSFLVSKEARRGAHGSYLDCWENTSSSGDWAQLLPGRERHLWALSCGVIRTDLELIFIVTLVIRVTSFLFSANSQTLSSTGMYTVCKLCTITMWKIHARELPVFGGGLERVQGPGFRLQRCYLLPHAINSSCVNTSLGLCKAQIYGCKSSSLQLPFAAPSFLLLK